MIRDEKCVMGFIFTHFRHQANKQQIVAQAESRVPAVEPNHLWVKEFCKKIGTNVVYAQPKKRKKKKK